MAADSKALLPQTIVNAFKTKDRRAITHYIVADSMSADATDIEGNTILHLAARYALSDMAALHLEWWPKTNPNLWNKQGDAPMHLAVKHAWLSGYRDKYEYDALCQKKQDDLERSIEERHNFRFFSYEDFDDIFEMLASFGADLNIKNKEGNTPLQALLIAYAYDSDVRMSGEQLENIIEKLVIWFNVDIHTNAKNGQSFVEHVRKYYSHNSFLDRLTQLSKESISKKLSILLNEVNELRQIVDKALISKEKIRVMRVELSRILSQYENDKSDIVTENDLNQAYEDVLFLTEFKPINEEDPILLCEIEEDHKIVLSTGHQFDIYALIQYHNSRSYQGLTLGEQHEQRWLINPLTNQKFSLRDAHRIQAMAKNKNIEIQYLKNEIKLPESLAIVPTSSNLHGFHHHPLAGPALNSSSSNIPNPN